MEIAKKSLMVSLRSCLSILIFSAITGVGLGKRAWGEEPPKLEKLSACASILFERIGNLSEKVSKIYDQEVRYFFPRPPTIESFQDLVNQNHRFALRDEWLTSGRQIGIRSFMAGTAAGLMLGLGSYFPSSDAFPLALASSLLFGRMFFSQMTAGLLARYRLGMALEGGTLDPNPGIRELLKYAIAKPYFLEISEPEKSNS